jgi:YVTN family beta-propeller protein
VAVSPDGRKVYVANDGSETVSVIDTATNMVIATIGTRGSVGIAVSPDGGRVYAANLGDQSLSVIDTGTNTVIATVPVGVFPYGVVVADKKVYVTNCTAQCSSSSPGTVTVLDAVTDKVIATIPVAPTTNAPGLAVSPDGRKVYVTNEVSDNVPVIDTATDKVIATIPVADSTSSAVSPDGTKVYIPNRGNHVAVVDAATNTVITGTGFINGGLFGVSVTPDGQKVFVANYAANTVSVIDRAAISRAERGFGCTGVLQRQGAAKCHPNVLRDVAQTASALKTAVVCPPISFPRRRDAALTHPNQKSATPALSACAPGPSATAGSGSAIE